MDKRTRTRIAIVAVGVLFGLTTGIGGYTFVYARSESYLTNNPKACANCQKADHGFWHSYAISIGDFHEPIAMKSRSRVVVPLRRIVFRKAILS